MAIKEIHSEQLNHLVESITQALWEDFEVTTQAEMDEIVAELKIRAAKIQSPEIDEDLYEED